MAKKKADPTVLAPEPMPVPVVVEDAVSIPVPMDDIVAEMPVEDSATQGGADVPEQAFAVPEEVISFSAGASVPGTAAVQIADLRSVRKVIDTLVYGCSSTREREEAAKSAVEVLDKLIGE
jgi:hypothetical protein